MRSEAVTTKETTQFLTFTVAEEEYAVPVLRVREILAYVPLTRVPRAPQFVAGVMNLRGSVVPVIDLRIKLGLEAATINSRTCIVIVDVETEQGPSTMALLTDDVKQVMELAADEIEPAPTFGTRIDLSFLLGMGDLGERFALILNVDKVLTTLELIAASDAVKEAATEPATEESRPRKGSKRAKRTEVQ
jgi:purine-binding chemotaxis protein CheW